MKYLAWVGGVILVALVAWGSLHMFAPTINPEQRARPTHVQSACWACHIISGRAATVDVSQ